MVAIIGHAHAGNDFCITENSVVLRQQNNPEFQKRPDHDGCLSRKRDPAGAQIDVLHAHVHIIHYEPDVILAQHVDFLIQ